MAQVKKEAFVWDFTFMNHLLRVHLDLSANEYIYMDMVARLANQHGGYTGLSNKSAAQAVGVSISTIKIFIETLTKKGLLESKDSCIGDCVPKRGTVLWWELYNKLLPKNENLTTPQSNLNRGSQNLTTPNQKQTTRKLKLPNRNKKVATIDNPIVSTIENTTFSEEKDSSEKSKDFSTSTENKKIAANSNVKKTLFSQDENQKEKEKSCAKKEKAETPETEGEDYLTAGQLPTYNQLQIKPELWGAFVGAVVKRLPTQKPKNKIKRSIFVSWATKLKAIENKFADVVIISHFQDYENKTWQSPFFTGYAETLQKAQKDYNFTNQNNNNQNATTHPTTKPNAQPDANTFYRVLERDRERNELGY